MTCPSEQAVPGSLRAESSALSWSPGCAWSVPLLRLLSWRSRGLRIACTGVLLQSGCNWLSELAQTTYVCLGDGVNQSVSSLKEQSVTPKMGDG